MRISDWSSDVCSSDLFWGEDIANAAFVHYPDERWFKPGPKDALPAEILDEYCLQIYNPDGELRASHLIDTNSGNVQRGICSLPYVRQSDSKVVYRSEEHTSELQSLMRISYAVFCLKKKKKYTQHNSTITH